MIEYIKMIILGIVQGISEFLPISSSGHIVILEKLFKIEEPGIFVAQMLHFGTFLSVLYFFRNDIIILIKEFLIMIKRLFKGEKFKLNKYQKTDVYIIVGSFFTAIIALLFEDIFKAFYDNTKYIAIMFLITAVLLYFIDRSTNNKKEISNINGLGAAGIGMVQGLAIIPGISRSGSTIFAGTFIGVKKEDAARFSFLLSLPATFGAFLFGIKDVISSSEAVSFSIPLILGVVFSAIVGVFSLKFLLNLISKNKLSYFSIYLIIIAIISFFL